MRENPQSGGCLNEVLRSLLIPLIGIMACALVTFVAIDVTCANQAQVVRYPGALLVDEQGGFVRPFGMGKTTIRLTTDAPPGLVRRWYQDTVRVVADWPYVRAATTYTWSLSPNEQGGTDIQLDLECAYA